MGASASANSLGLLDFSDGVGRTEATHRPANQRAWGTEVSRPLTLTFLGAGAAFSRRYGTTCSVLCLPNGQQWLIDCGRQAPEQLHAAGIGWHDIAGQIVTHVHGDHVFGIEEFALTRFFERQGAIDPILEGGPRPKLVAHSSVRAELWEVLAPSLRYLPDTPTHSRAGTLADYFDICKATRVGKPDKHSWPAAEDFAVDDLCVDTREVVHIPGKPSFALELGPTTATTRAYWSGDATVDAAVLIALEPKVSVFFHDCTFVPMPLQVHGSFAELAALPQAVRRKMVLMHHEDDLDEHRSEILARGFRIAEPGDRYDLSSGQQIA